MTNNDQIILDKIVEEQRKSRFASASKSDFFEIYVAEQVLKDFDLSDEELESGLVGNGGDGGIDGIYIFANGDLVQEDFDSEPLKKSVLIEVVIVQAKTSATFDEDSMNRFTAVSRDLFDLTQPLANFKSVYNKGVRSTIGTFRQLYTKIAGRFPRLQFRYFYATRGDSNLVHPNVARKQEDIHKAIKSHFSSAKFDFTFLGASDLLNLARRQPITTYDLKITESLSAKDGYIALVRLKEFFSFVRDDETGQIRKNLFEANVRDYQGNNQVNEEIQNSLQEESTEDFWWLNNGITIVSTKAVQSGKVLTIEDPQIVNGQQTSTEIYNYFKNFKTDSEDRCVMVRVIVATDPASRDKIIKATNYQTQITPATLRATDKIHRDIEEYLAPFGIYYDRRKNSQKNLGRPVEKIISISLLAQSMMAMVLQRPDSARARPSSLLKKNEDYDHLFSTEYPIEIYLFVARTIKSIQSYLRSLDSLQPKDRTNLIFYIAMHASAVLSKKQSPNISDLLAIGDSSLTDEVLASSLTSVKELYETLGASDQVAKGTQLLADLKSKLKELFGA
ncbi:MAG: AIPR protein [Solidesulfovibrio magneticus str. Maddingley MBC34]|uniref:AIPR protein n=1 Tax=Solidesulfovibrio magneticus str. Maddingley MBC34 TaxID=1206767 RepID=K6GRB0_9BACT|nr:MAG: AIPR protein [Solidesulfovibrio magneticus str. Maddingley MBC34]